MNNIKKAWSPSENNNIDNEFELIFKEDQKLLVIYFLISIVLSFPLYFFLKESFFVDLKFGDPTKHIIYHKYYFKIYSISLLLGIFVLLDFFKPEVNHFRRKFLLNLNFEFLVAIFAVISFFYFFYTNNFIFLSLLFLNDNTKLLNILYYFSFIISFIQFLGVVYYFHIILDFILSLIFKFKIVKD